MVAVRAEKIGQELCKALGQNSFNVSRVEIICQAGGVAKVIIERYLDSEEVGLLQRTLKEYELVEKGR